VQPEKQIPERTYRLPQDDELARRKTSASRWNSARGPRWADCPIDDLVVLAEQVPDAYKQVIALEGSRRRLEWAALMAQIAGHLSGLVALFILAAVAWHAIDNGAATQAASIICTGAVSTVALFVTGETRASHYRRNQLAKDCARKCCGRTEAIELTLFR
jgi:hypothetical protein